ncbi:MAG: hypothetical protein GEV07_11640 [Streptosporangiales bacterium]|nr:hypothetical protein [Streptosporangiales bacterium]
MRTEKSRRRLGPAPLADEIYDYLASVVGRLDEVEMQACELDEPAHVQLISPRRATDVVTELVDIMAAGTLRVVFAVHGAAPQPWTRMRVYHVDEPLAEYTVAISHAEAVNGSAVGDREYAQHAG